MSRIFTKLEKPLFGPTLSFKKARIHHYFKLDNTLFLCKKSEKFYELFERKTSDKQTHGQTDEGIILLGYHIKCKTIFALPDYRIANKILYAVSFHVSFQFYFFLFSFDLLYQKKNKIKKKKQLTHTVFCFAS